MGGIKQRTVANKATPGRLQTAEMQTHAVEDGDTTMSELGTAVRPWWGPLQSSPRDPES